MIILFGRGEYRLFLISEFQAWRKQMKRVLARTSAVILIAVFSVMAVTNEHISSRIISLVFTLSCLCYLLYDWFLRRTSIGQTPGMCNESTSKLDSILFFGILMMGGVIVGIGTYVSPPRFLLLRISLCVISGGGVFLCGCHIVRILQGKGPR